MWLETPKLVVVCYRGKKKLIHLRCTGCETHQVPSHPGYQRFSCCPGRQHLLVHAASLLLNKGNPAWNWWQPSKSGLQLAEFRKWVTWSKCPWARESRLRGVAQGARSRGESSAWSCRLLSSSAATLAVAVEYSISTGWKTRTLKETPLSQTANAIPKRGKTTWKKTHLSLFSSQVMERKKYKREKMCK